MSDLRIRPFELQVGDWITSDPRRDFYVGAVIVDEYGDTIINAGTADRARILRDQTVAIMPRHIGALRPRPTAD